MPSSDMITRPSVRVLHKFYSETTLERIEVFEYYLVVVDVRNDLECSTPLRHSQIVA